MTRVAQPEPQAGGEAAAARAGQRLRLWWDGLQVSGQGEETVICGLLADKPALHGLLTKVRDLGLCLICVRWLDTVQDRNGRQSWHSGSC